MRLCAQHRLRLSLTHRAHGPFPSSSTACLLSLTHLSTIGGLSLTIQARISTSAARLAASRKTLQSPLNWSQTAHRPRTPSAPSLSSMAAEQRAGQAQEQIRGHAGHSHAHGHHHHDNTFLTSRNRNDPGVRITMIGLYVNVGMAVSKGIGGYVFNSQAYVLSRKHGLPVLRTERRAAGPDMAGLVEHVS